MSAEELRGRLSDDIWTSYFKFCIVRNPYDQLISCFYFMNRDLSTQAFDARHRDLFARWLATAELPRDSARYKIEGKPCLDFMIRYESIESGMRTVCSRVGVEWNPDVFPFYKAGIRPAAATAEAMYSTEARQFVKESYETELRDLGYSFPSE